MSEASEYTVKAVKSFTGREGYGFNANLYRGKKKVAFVTDAAQGGEFDFDWESREEKAIFDEMITRQPSWTSEYNGNDGKPMIFAMSADVFVSGLVESFEEAKLWKSRTRKKTFFQLEGYGKNEWSTLNFPVTDARAIPYLVKKYGDTVTKINNCPASDFIKK